MAVVALQDLLVPVGLLREGPELLLNQREAAVGQNADHAAADIHVGYHRLAGQIALQIKVVPRAVGRVPARYTLLRPNPERLPVSVWKKKKTKKLE